MKNLLNQILALSPLVLLAPSLWAKPTLVDLGRPGDDPTPSPVAASEGATVIAVDSFSQNTRTFLWTQAEGYQVLAQKDFRVHDVNADGRFYVGGTSSADGPGSFRGSEAGDIQTFGRGGGGNTSVATGISDDGSVVVGFERTGSPSEAYRWTEATGVVGLGMLPGAETSSASAISGDGSTIVGTSGNSAFRWTEAGGMESLGELPGGGPQIQVEDVNADGSVVVGWSSSQNGQEAFRWTREEGMVGLGDLPGDTFNSRAWAVSRDGRVVVGDSFATAGNLGFVHADGRMVSVRDLLREQGFDPSGWEHIGSAEFVVGDGFGGYLVGGEGTLVGGQRTVYLANFDLGGNAPLVGSWSLHQALGWVYVVPTGWQFSDSLQRWFWIDGQWGYTVEDGWYWLAIPAWIWRERDDTWVFVG